MTTGLLLGIDRTVTEHEYEDLAALQAAVGGYVQPVYLQGGSVLWINEEGLLKFDHETDQNPVASALALTVGPVGLLMGPGILGPCVVQGPPSSPDAGDVTPVPNDLRELIAWINQLAE